MRTLGIDYGQKRIGLAQSDESGKFASPSDVIDSTPAAVEEIARRVVREQIARVVVGLPINMDGTLGASARSVIAWARRLESVLGLEVVFVDERLSSFDAEQRIISAKRSGAKITRKQKKSRLDAMSAAVFLQAFLDGELAAQEIPRD